MNAEPQTFGPPIKIPAKQYQPQARRLYFPRGKNKKSRKRGALRIPEDQSGFIPADRLAFPGLQPLRLPNRKPTIDDWLKRLAKLPPLEQSHCACVVWWDHFGNRESTAANRSETKAFQHWLKMKLDHCPRAQLVAALQTIGYTLEKAESRLPNEDRNFFIYNPTRTKINPTTHPI